MNHQENIISTNDKSRNQIVHHQYSKHSFRSRISSKTHLLIFINSSHFSISSMNSIFDQKSNQKSRYSINTFRSNFHLHDRNTNHLFSSRILQNCFYFISNSIILFLLLDSFNTQLENFETFRQFLDIEAILLFKKSIWTSIHRFINSVSFFYFGDRLDIQSKSQYHLEFRNFQYSCCFNIEIIYFFREYCQNIFVFFTDRSYFLIWAIVSISISKIAKTFFFNIRYSHHLFCLKTFQNHICLSSKSILIFSFWDDFNVSTYEYFLFRIHFWKFEC